MYMYKDFQLTSNELNEFTNLFRLTTERETYTWAKRETGEHIPSHSHSCSMNPDTIVARKSCSISLAPSSLPSFDHDGSVDN